MLSKLQTFIVTLVAAKSAMMAEADMSEWEFGSFSDVPAALVGGGTATSSYLDTEGDTHGHVWLFRLPACLRVAASRTQLFI